MIKPWETRQGTVFCPVNGWDCSYYGEHGVCELENVQNKCDEFYKMWADKIEAEKEKNN